MLNGGIDLFIKDRLGGSGEQSEFNSCEAEIYFDKSVFAVDR